MKMYKPSEYEITCDICGESIMKRVSKLPFIFGHWFCSGRYDVCNTYKYKYGTSILERHLCYNCNGQMIAYIRDRIEEKGTGESENSD